MDTEFDTTTVSFDESTGVGHLMLDRPDSLNALSGQLRANIIDGLRWLNSKNDDAEGVALRAVVIEGAGGNFCAGADINEFSDSDAGGSSERAHFQFIMDFPAPVIAKIRGYCLGGGLETACACDFRFAHEDSRLGLPEVDLGIIPGAGGVQYISRLANPSIAKEIAMTGDYIDAERAHEFGIVNRVCGDDLDEEVTTFVEKIASKPPLSVQAIKESADVAVQSGLREGLKYDRTLFGPLSETQDHEEGVRAFAEDDYEPEFVGR